MNLNTPVFLGNSLQNMLIFIGIVLAAAVIGKIVEIIFDKVLKHLVRKTETEFDDIIIEEIGKVIFHILVVVGIFAGSLFLTLEPNIKNYFIRFIKILFIIIIIRFLLSFWDSIVKRLINPIVEKSENDINDLILPVISRTVRIIIIIMGLIMVLSDLGFNVLSFVAGLGIMGMALALASKDFVANLFGAFSVYSDQMFNISDKIKVKGEEGKVIEIGLRSTKIKKEDGIVVIIPNSLMTSNPVTNFTYKKNRKKKTKK
jgi:MscS family membrane protein